MKAETEYSIGDRVAYKDHQDRTQYGKILGAKCQWYEDYTMHVSYTIEHPTYRHNRHVCYEDKVLGVVY